MMREERRQGLIWHFVDKTTGQCLRVNELIVNGIKIQQQSESIT